MEDIIKKCILCGNEFIGSDDNKPNHQICRKCSHQLTRHINPKISKIQRLLEITIFILFYIPVFHLFISELKKVSFENMFKLGNSTLLIAVVVSVVAVALTIYIFIDEIKNKS